jgi:membrane protein
LNIIWKVESAKTDGVREKVVARIRAIALVLGVGSLLFVIVSADTRIAITGKYAAHHLLGGEPLWQAIQLIVSIVVLTILFAIRFRYVDVEAP